MSDDDSSAWSSVEKRIQRAWLYWHSLGAPKFIVAPMVDQSELPFRMMCRKYGAKAAYTPMLHARLFATTPKYRSEFTTCPEDRPLFVQFCANDPDTLVQAATLVAPHCDYVDLNLGCPQRIAKRGNYGAFLMDNKPLIHALVSKMASSLSVPVSCKIRIHEKLEDTLAYAQMLQEAGCSLLAVHGRTRDQKCGKTIRADWNAIRAVKEAVRIPVIANGNVRWLEDAYDCLKFTGVDGVMSAEALLENPALFSGRRVLPVQEGSQHGSTGDQSDSQVMFHSSGQSTDGVDAPNLVLEYLQFCDKYPVPMRMVRAHVHRILGNWLRVHSDLRDELNRQLRLSPEWIRDMVLRLIARSSTIQLPELQLSQLCSEDDETRAIRYTQTEDWEGI